MKIGLKHLQELWMVALSVLALLPVVAYGETSPYMGQEGREVKALSPQEVQGYLTGQGMGFAKAAELNHYPGPRHVLDLAAEMKLSEGQIEKTKAIYRAMQGEAIRLGRLLVEKERTLDGLFARQEAGEAAVRSVAAEIAGLQGELRFAHLKAHLEMRRILSQEQIQQYDALRGYGAGEGKGPPAHHQHTGH